MRLWFGPLILSGAPRWGVKNAIYETSLTDARAYLKPMLPKPAKRGRPPIYRRPILDAILYVVKCGCPWRYLRMEFPQIFPLPNGLSCFPAMDDQSPVGGAQRRIVHAGAQNARQAQPT
jgi:hypothetical protein